MFKKFCRLIYVVLIELFLWLIKCFYCDLEYLLFYCYYFCYKMIINKCYSNIERCVKELLLFIVKYVYF